VTREPPRRKIMDAHKRMRPHVRPHVELDDGSVFVPDYRRGFIEVDDGDAEALGEEFIASATSGEGVGEDARNEPDGDELTGFVVESFANDDDLQKN
jgi:hypothetical protein